MIIEAAEPIDYRVDYGKMPDFSYSIGAKTDTLLGICKGRSDLLSRKTSPANKLTPRRKLPKVFKTSPIYWGLQLEATELRVQPT